MRMDSYVSFRFNVWYFQSTRCTALGIEHEWKTCIIMRHSAHSVDLRKNALKVHLNNLKKIADMLVCIKVVFMNFEVYHLHHYLSMAQQFTVITLYLNCICFIFLSFLKLYTFFPSGALHVVPAMSV